MNHSTLVVVVLPGSAPLLEADVAGRPAGDYLYASLAQCQKVDVWRSSPGDTHAVDQPATQGVLIVDARAGFFQGALSALLARTGGAKRVLRIVRGAPPASAAQPSVTTLAVYLPSGEVKPRLCGSTGTITHEVLTRVLRSTAIANEDFVEASRLDPSASPLWIESYEALAELERRVFLARAAAAMKQGVRIRDPKTLYVRGALACGSGVEIEANVVIDGDVTLGHGVKLSANSIVRSASIGDHTCIRAFSLVEHATIGARAFVGPYGRIRPGSTIGDGVQIGNFVEIKNSQIGAGSRINHHSFIGDARLADFVTVGAGTITCNHDGTGTTETVIEEGAYIGSACSLVAPLRIGAGATIGAGSTITHDVPAAKLTLARSPQTTIADWRGPRSRRQKQ